MLARVNRGLGVCSSGKSNPAGRDAPPGSYDELGTLAVPWQVVATRDRLQLSACVRQRFGQPMHQTCELVKKSRFLNESTGSVQSCSRTKY